MRLRPILTKHRLRLGDGLKVRIFGHLDFFAPSGQLGLKMSGLDPRFTLGEMALERDDVVRRLVASGLFDANRRTQLSPPHRCASGWSPARPARPGATSPTSSIAAGWPSGSGSSTCGCRASGRSTWSSSALRTLTRHDDLDVVVLIRGGGSKTELATFDHESIATAIATSPLPVFTGLGHEIDRSVADEVAHSSLKTPTACAAALVERVYAFQADVERVWSAIDRHANRALHEANASLGHRRPRRSPGDGVGGRTQRRSPRSPPSAARHSRPTARSSEQPIDLVAARASLGRVPARLEPELRHVDAVAARVRLLDPVHTMARGWSITRTGDGTVVRSADDLAPGATIITTFATGQRTKPRRGDQHMTEPVATGYAAALAELETILGELERADVDVDVLADPGQARRRADRVLSRSHRQRPAAHRAGRRRPRTTDPGNDRRYRSSHHVGNIIDLHRRRDRSQARARCGVSRRGVLRLQRRHRQPLLAGPSRSRRPVPAQPLRPALVRDHRGRHLDDRLRGSRRRRRRRMGDIGVHDPPRLPPGQAVGPGRVPHPHAVRHGAVADRRRLRQQAQPERDAVPRSRRHTWHMAGSSTLPRRAAGSARSSATTSPS